MLRFNMHVTIGKLFSVLPTQDGINLARVDANPCFEGMVNRIGPSQLQKNKSNASYTEVPCLIQNLL